MQAVVSIFLVLTALAAQAGDQELFDRARALWDQGQQKEAAKAFRDLIKNYPTSKYVPDAYLAFGEYYFDQGNLEKALMAYKKVVEFRDSKVYSYAMYKMGWCYYNIMEYDRALYDLVIFSHREANQPEAFRLVRKLANYYLQLFPHSPRADKIRGLIR